jgi:hypothetical protein
MATPTLTMIPSGYKAQKVYSVLPTNGDGDFTFDRNNAGTRVNKDGLIEQVSTDVPRLDYSDGSCPSLLLEPASTNLAGYSEDFSQVWNKDNSTVTTNQTTSPSGDLTADKFISDDTNQPRVERAFTVPATDTTYTFSVFVKKINTRYIGLSRFSGGQGAIFDFDTKSVVSSSAENASIKEFSNGWFRISITQTVLSTDSFNIWKINGTNGSSIGTGVVGDETFIWGAQLEALPYLSSYIQTPTNSSESRSAETFSNDFSSQPTVANTNTVVLKFIPMGFDVDFAELLRFSDGTNEIALEGFSTNNYDMYGSGLTSSGMVDGALSLDAGSINTISFSYSGTSLRFSHNGSTINTVAPTGNLPTITEVSHSVGGLSPIKILDLRVYNDFKTQEELNTLTI